MKVEGGCFCGSLRYEAEGEPVMRAACFCRQCQYFAGGSPNVFLAMPYSGFRYTKGQPKTFARDEAPVFPVGRDFCPECGVHVIGRSKALPDVVFLKVGSLDNPPDFGKAELAIFTCDQQPFHQLPPDAQAFEKMPPL